MRKIAANTITESQDEIMGGSSVKYLKLIINIYGNSINRVRMEIGTIFLRKKVIVSLRSLNK